jgi:hypothetical protein
MMIIIWSIPLYLYVRVRNIAFTTTTTDTACISFNFNNQHNAQICTTALFYMLAPTFFGSSVPSSGSFWIRPSWEAQQTEPQHSDTQAT